MILNKTLQTRLVTQRSCERRTTVSSLHFVWDCPPWYSASWVHGWAMSGWNCFWGFWYFLDSLQKLAFHLVPKPSLPIENNLLQKLHETAVNSSYITLPKWVPLVSSEAEKNWAWCFLLPSVHQIRQAYYTNLFRVTFLLFPWPIRKTPSFRNSR